MRYTEPNDNLLCLSEVSKAEKMGRVIYIDDEIPHPPVHWHSNLEINYFIEGGFTAYIDEKYLEVESDTLLLVNSGDVHFLGEYPLGEQSGISVIFDIDFLRHVCPSFPHCRFDLSQAPDHGQQIKYCCRQIFEMYAARSRTADGKQWQPFAEYEQLRVNGFICLITYELVKHCLIRDPNGCSHGNLRQDICSAVNFIDENHTEDLSLQTVADYCGISREHFSRSFHQQMGMGFQEYLMRIRLQHAYRLLLRTNDRILDISLRTGFSDLRCFNRWFKRIYGMTPTECRKNFREPSKITDMDQMSEEK